MKSKGLAKGWVNNAWEHSPEVLLEQRLGKSGGSVLRMTVFRKFEVCASNESSVVKIATFAKPPNVISHFKKTEYATKIIND